jgi:hypothetical protein
MKKFISIPGFIILCVAAAGFITLAFFVGTWTGSSGKVSITGAFVTVPRAITGTPSSVEYKVSVPDTGVDLAGVTVNFSTTSRYVTFNPTSGSVTTDAKGLAVIEVVTKEGAPAWASSAIITAECTVEDINLSHDTMRLSVKAG